jgi:hypothetical protein
MHINDCPLMPEISHRKVSIVEMAVMTEKYSTRKQRLTIEVGT